MTDISKEAVEDMAKGIAANLGGIVHEGQDVSETLLAQAARIAELEAQKQSLEADLEDLQMEYDEHQTKVSADFEGDCWVSMRALLEATGFDGWSDPDGVTADAAYQHMKEKLDEFGKAVERIAELEAALKTVREDALTDAMNAIWHGPRKKCAERANGHGLNATHDCRDAVEALIAKGTT